MGLLDNVLGGGSQQQQGGGMSPMTIALLGLLAYQTMSGKGGLAGMLGGNTDGDAAPGQVPNPSQSAGQAGGLGDLLGGAGGGLGGLLGGAGAGGLGGLLGGLLGGGNRGAAPAGGLGDLLGGAGGAGGLGGILGSVLGGGAAGGALSGGLGDLLNRFQESGQGDVADSWVQPGPNKQLSREDVERALDPEMIDRLAAQSGMDRDEMLDGFARSLPNVIDKLTPDGRLPTRDEADGWLRG